MRSRAKRFTGPNAPSGVAQPSYNRIMANLTLVYGMRLLPADEIARVGDAPIELKNGNEARVTMHVLEGSREEIEKQLKMSLDAFFDFYPEI
jgi:hypothetical protein